MAPVSPHGSARIASFGIALLRRLDWTDLDWAVGLRNRPEVRQWFFDAQAVELSVGRDWLMRRADSDSDTLLVICHGESGRRVGTLGWMLADADRRVYETGRFVLGGTELRALLRERVAATSELKGLGADACLALREHLFSVRNASRIVTAYKPGNVLAARINESVGLQRTGGEDGERVACELTRERWLHLSERS